MPFQYMGGNTGDKIAQAFADREERKRRADLDAVQTGVGMHSYDPSAPENAPSPGFGGRIRQVYAKVTGQADPVAADHAQWNMAQHPPQTGVTGSTLGADVQPAQADPSGYPDRMQLPSGEVVETRFTPFGERMQAAALQREYNKAIVGIRGDQAERQIQLRGDVQQQLQTPRLQNAVEIANGRNATTVQTTTMRNAQSNTNSQRSASTAIRGQDLRTGLSGSRGGAVDSPLVHRGALIGKQLSATNAEIKADQKVLDGGLPRRATSVDSANYNGVKQSVARLRQRADSLTGVLDQVGAQMGGVHEPVSVVDPTSGMSDADAWEYHVKHGLTPVQATAAVQGRHK